MPQDRETAATKQFLQDAETAEQQDLETAGVNQSYQLWRETMPNTRMDENAALGVFLESQEIEAAAQDGALSVVTGEPEEGPGTDIPTPGPDDEGTRPDEAGEVSEGAAGDADPSPTDVVPIEGMWMPPPEAEADNFEPPTTTQMVQSDEWMENARIFWEFMGEPNTHQKGGREGLVGFSAAELTGGQEMSDDDIAEWAESQMAQFNWHLPSTANLGSKIMSANDPKAALATMNLMNMYDFSDGGAYEFGRAITMLGLDPTTYVGLGVGTAAARGVAKVIAKEGIKKAVQLGLTGGTAGAIEGGMVTGGFDLVKQEVEKEAGVREETDLGQTALATTIGVGAGTLLGGGIGYLVGRNADKTYKLLQEELTRQLGGTRRDKVKQAAELSVEELLQMVEASQRATELTGGMRDPEAEAALKLLGSPEELPRLEDGSIDQEAVVKILDDLTATREERVAKAKQDLADEAQRYGHGDAGKPDTETTADDLIKYAKERGETFESMGTDAADVDDLKIYLREAQEELGVSDKVVEEAIAKLENAPDYQVEALAHEFRTQWLGLSDETPLADIDDIIVTDEGITFPGHMFDTIDDFEEIARQARVGGARAIHPEQSVSGQVEVRGTKEEIANFMSIVLSERDAGYAARHKEIYGVEPGTPIPDNVIPFPTAEARGLTPETKELFVPEVAKEESIKLAQKLVELDELAEGGVVPKAPGRPGSTIADELGEQYELIGHTKNGWYKAVHLVTGDEKNFRRREFSVQEAAPKPTRAGVQSLAPLDESAARIVAMAEEISERPLQHVTVTHAEQQKLASEMEALGIDVTAKELTSRWTPAEILQLRNTYQAMGKQLLQFAKSLSNMKKGGGAIPDTELAYFNAAHAKFMATRDLFYGVKGEAARQLNILQSRPKDAEYDFSDSIMDLISQKGGRINTERAIDALAEIELDDLAKVTSASEKIWDTKIGSALLNVRYNMMLSSWRTHFFNFLGNSASGVWETGIISPTKMAINNLWYAREMAWHHMLGEAHRYGAPKPDPADRLRLRTWQSEFQGHYAATRDSLYLAKEIALGRDIGEGKVWNELGLRYDVVNVPETAFGKLGTTPVRMLEAGDAFFKNQYYSAKIHVLAERRARAEEIHQGLDFKTRYHHWIEKADPDMQKEAKAYASKLTYTNDPNVYGGILASLAKMIQTGQSRSLFINWLVPFVRTPANLLSYSMEQIGANTVLSPSKTWADINSPDISTRHEAQARIAAAAGLWATARSLYERGLCTGAGPPNWEERRAWENAGWQANSCKIGGNWVDLSRAQPAGLSLNTMMTAFDWFALNHDDSQGPPHEWIGQFLLYTSDMIKDESYLSTITDYIVAVDSKEATRGQAIAASTVNSFLVPNLLRDIRMTTDAGKRTTVADNLLDAVLKQMKNAMPGKSQGLPPARDAFGQPVEYYSSAYLGGDKLGRAVIPFNIRDPDKADTAAMAVAYARVPMSVPPKNFSLPGRQNSLDLLAMDENAGWVYDRYVKFVGESRHETVSALVNNREWAKLVEDKEVGPGSFGDAALRQAVAAGHQLGKARFLEFLIDTKTFETGGPDSKTILIQHPFTPKQYKEMLKIVLGERGKVPDDFPQYNLLEKEEGPEFFKP